MANGCAQQRTHPRIADFSTHLSGPYASHLLRELGAEVIKVENPRTGDGNRGASPRIGGVGDLHVALGPGARSIAVDRRSPHWPAVVEACVEWADAVVVGARPSDAVRLGLDLASVVRISDDIVYCLISGYGERGPWRDFTAHGQNVDAMAGLVPLEWVDGQPRTRAGWRSAGTTLAGIYAALGIMYALYRRARGATGCLHVSIPVWRAAMAWSWRDTTCVANLGHPWNEYQDLGSRYRTYATADGRALILAPIERKFWQAFCDLTGLGDLRDAGDWSEGMDFGKGPAHDDERKRIAAVIANGSLAGWMDRLRTAGIPFAPVLTIEEALASDHAEAQGVLRSTEVDGVAVRVPASPVRITEDGADSPLPPIDPPPGLGEHTEEILTELGLRHLSAADLRSR